MGIINSYEFPNEFVSIEEKKTMEYGLQYAKAMFASFTGHGARVFYNASVEYESLIEFAQGRQSLSDVKKLFGFFGNDGEETSLKYIDIQALNIAPTKINQVVEKLCKRKYDVSATTIDPLSNDYVKEWEATVKTAQQLQGFMDSIGVSAKEIFPELNLNIAQIPDEYLLEFEMPPKHKMSLTAEKTLKLIMEYNNYEAVERDAIWDAVVLGKGVIRAYFDKNGNPRFERVHPATTIMSHSKTEDHTGKEYGGHIDYITPSQFIKESSEFLTAEQQEEIMAHFNTTYRVGYAEQGYIDIDHNYDGLSYIPVMRYTFRSEDTETFVSKKNQHKNKIIKKRPFEFDVDNDANKEKYRLFGGDWDIMRTTETNIYGGTWVVGSEIVYGHDIMDMPATNLVDREIPYILITPNMKDGRFVSIAAQMVEPIFQINVAWNKIKDILAREWMGVLEVDFDSIENVNMGKGGKAWTPYDVMEFLLQKKIKISRRGDGQTFNPGPGINNLNVGLQMADYFETIRLSLEMLDQLTGTGVGDSSSPPERTGLGVMQNAIQASNNALGQLFFAKREAVKNLFKRLLPMAQMALKNGVVMRGHLPALGNKTAEFFEVNKDLSLYEFGLIIEDRPSDEEWFEFHQDVRAALEKGVISPSDSAFLRDIDNLKQARITLGIKEKKNRLEAQKREDYLIQVNQENALQANQQSTDNQLLVDNNQHKNKMEELRIQLQTEYMIASLQANANAVNKQEDVWGKIEAKRIEGEDRLLTQQLKNEGDKEKIKLTPKPKNN